MKITNLSVKAIASVIMFVLAVAGTYFAYRAVPASSARLTVTVTYAHDVLAALRSQYDGRFRIQLTEIGGRPLEPSTLDTLDVVSVTISNDGGQPFRWTDRVTEPVAFVLRGDGAILGVGEPLTQPSSRSRGFRYEISRDKKAQAFHLMMAIMMIGVLQFAGGAWLTHIGVIKSWDKTVRGQEARRVAEGLARSR